MGSSSSKFRKHLSNGDEYAALNQYNNSSELRKALDPNSSYGDSHNHETPLHYASKFAMKSLLRIFLSEHNGNPNKTNGMKQTCLHCVCMEKAEHSQVYPVMKRRAECLAMLLKWRGARLEDNETERVNLGAQDEEQNTALHYAALSGLKQCVEMLVQHGAPLFQENCDNQTPCDSAEKGGHADIALYLESKMVFSADGPELDDEDMYIMPDSEEYNGLRAQDLQEAKDQLLVETADMLSVPLFILVFSIYTGEYNGLRAQDLQEAKDQLQVETADMLSVPLFILVFSIYTGEYNGLRAQDLQEAKDQLQVETADMLSVPLFILVFSIYTGVQWTIAQDLQEAKDQLLEYNGLRAQDLQEAKDQLLVETADMLSVPLFILVFSIYTGVQWTESSRFTGGSGPVTGRNSSHAECSIEYNGLRAQDLQEAKDPLLVETADMLSVPLFILEFSIYTGEYNGLRAQDLQEAKDQLLVETADMLSVPLFILVFSIYTGVQWTESSRFTGGSGPVTGRNSSHAECSIEYNGLRAQDLQEAKDQLLVETADMLSVPLFTAEALLRNHEWSREILLEAWMTDPKACCEKSGVIPPPSVFSEQPHVQHSLSSIEPTMTSQHDVECDICTSSFITNEDPVQMACLHQFCKDCWQIYLDLKIQEGEAHNITCPAYDCMKLVSVEVIESVVSRAMARRYLQFDIKAFVESNPNIKWCPFPGCGQAVKMPETYIKLPSDTSKAVDCGKGHLFCWECLGEAHEPASCENWKKWYNKIAEIRPEELRTTEEETENAANCLWLVTNSKSCPNCKSPIQKNEGCNHMKCCKCKYDFCWVCLDPWKRHNSSTGGYFKCNRYEAVKVVNEKVNKAQTEAEDHNTSMQELNKFVHYYTRFKNHENSYKLEEPLLSTTKNKMMKLAEAVTDIATANAETKFVEDAVHQLLKARRVLKCSYVYGYYLDGPGYKKIVFEFMQTELEECTEILSQMVNRLYLRTPRKRIIEQAQIVQRKRQEFLSAIMKGLVPPETPPGLRKQRRRKYSMDFEDDELRSAVLASIQDVDPANPWIKDASGRHTNVTAMLDWPDSDDSDTDVTTIIKLHGTCLRKGCSRTRVKNPRTGDWHEYCSRACMQADQIQASQEQEESQAEVVVDEQMDLLRALEMSRLLYNICISLQKSHKQK
ncbi:ANKIB1 [Mytilus coruscus]|uniref:RBR-type E3 ubiquitin transferase n=1 Tax=Mytilus coruscus TaxID=42192 RepID=A0A6J8EVS9_MYTCO|nr:ANKIB1 [Mytilus coruscus]